MASGPVGDLIEPCVANKRRRNAEISLDESIQIWPYMKKSLDASNTTNISSRNLKRTVVCRPNVFIYLLELY